MVAGAPRYPGTLNAELRRSRASVVAATPRPLSNGAGGGMGGDHLRSSVHTVLQQHFNTSELLRLSVPADIFQAMRAAAVTAAGGGGDAGRGGATPQRGRGAAAGVTPAGGGGVFTPAAVPTINEEETSKMSGGSGHSQTGGGVRER